MLYAALLVWLGAQLATAGVGRAAGVLAACLLAGALANAAAGMIQFYGLPRCCRISSTNCIPACSIPPSTAMCRKPICMPTISRSADRAAVPVVARRLRTGYALAAAVLRVGLGFVRIARCAAVRTVVRHARFVAGRMQAGAQAGRLKFAACIGGRCWQRRSRYPGLTTRSISAQRTRAHSNVWSV